MKSIFLILGLIYSIQIYAQQDLNFGVNGHLNINYTTSDDYVSFHTTASDSGFFYGTRDFAQQEAYIQKITPSGKVDSSFANGLFVYQPNINFTSVSFFDIKQLSDGSYLVGGTLNISSALSYALVLKLDQQGNLINSYNFDGRVTYAYNGHVSFGRKLLLASDEKFWIAGVYETSQFINRFFVCKFNQDGTPDTIFGNNAVLVKDIVDNQFEPVSFTKISAKSMMVIGRALGSAQGKMVALRFDTTGVFDANFGTLGEKILTGFPYFSSAKAILHKHNFYMAGGIRVGPNFDICAAVKTDTNFNADLNYGTNGLDTTFLNSPNISAFTGIEIDLADNLLFSGAHFESSGSEFVCIKKVLSSNTFDSTFGTNGILQIKNTNSANDYCNWSYLLNDQSLILGGHYYANGASNADITFCKIKAQNSLGLHLIVKRLHGISVYPNPSRGSLYLKSDNVLDHVNITVANNYGQLIHRKKIRSFAQHKLDMSAMPLGTYFVEIEKEGQRRVFKVIRE